MDKKYAIGNAALWAAAILASAIMGAPQTLTLILTASSCRMRRGNESAEADACLSTRCRATMRSSPRASLRSAFLGRCAASARLNAALGSK